jgi:AraC family transcriptional regulator
MDFTNTGDGMSLQESYIPFVGSPVRELSVSGNFRLVERTYPPCMSVPMHSHDRAFVGVTLAGVYTQTYQGREQEFRPGMITFLPKAEPHESRYSETGARVLHLEVPSHALRQFTSAGLCSDSYLVIRGGDALVAAQQLYREFQSPDALSPLILDGLAMRFLAQIFRQKSTTPKRQRTWLQEVEQYIRRHFREPLSLEEIANAVQVHPVHLAREYKRQHQRTVGERIRELRLESACDELLNTSLSLVEIALAAGYSDQSHFSVAFKRQKGTSPSEYRRQHTQLIPRKCAS